LEYSASQQFVARLPTASGTISLNSPQAIFGTWYHLAMVVDTVQHRLHLYVNGAPVPGSPVTYTGALSSLPTQVIGVMDEYYSRYRMGVNDPLFDWEKNFFTGELDEVRLYSQALSPAEVAMIYQQRPPTPSPLPTNTPVYTPTQLPTSSPPGPTNTPKAVPTHTPPSGSTNPPTSTPIIKPTRTPTPTPAP
jgi:hypothetical protein